MNEKNKDINNFLLIGDKFMRKMHLWDPKVCVHLLDINKELMIL